jgi:PAS domain S-box-containing protein
LARILIVEDESIEALDLKNSLQNMGHEVVYIASRGEEAIQKAKELELDIILMDIILKGDIDGIQAAEQIKKLNIPIVYLTAHSEDVTITRALQTNPYGYLLKPFDYTELKFTIDLALNKYKMEIKLLESEQRFRTIVETAQEGIWAMNENFETTFVNRKMSDMLGYQPDEMLGKIVSNFMFPEDLSDHNQKMDSREMGVSESYERRFRHKDGSEVWTIVSATALTTDFDGFKGSFATFTNITERKKTEKKLKESENKYREIYENAMEGIYQSTPQGTYITVNPAFAQISGYNTPEEMISEVDDIRRLYVNPKDRDYLAQVLEEYGEIKNLEAEFYNRSRDKIWLLINSKAVRDEEGNIKHYEGTVIDITDRKKAEIALQEKQNELNEIYNNIPDIIARFNPELQYTYVSSAAEIYMNLKIEHFIGKTNLEAGMPAENIELYDKAIRQVFLTGKSAEINLSFKRGMENRFYEARLIPEFSADGNVKSVLAVNRDITEQQKYQDQVLESKILFETMAQVAPVGIFHTDPEGKYIYVNQRWTEIAGISEENAMGDGWLNAVHQDDQKKTFNAWYAALWKNMFRLEYRFHDNYGNITWVLGEALPEIDDEGNVHGFVGTVTDITDLKNSENEILDSLNEKNVLLREIHHRVKNNLQIISSLINLQAKYVEADETVEILKESQNRVRAMAMVHENLYLSDTFSNIDMELYLEKLIRHLYISYGAERRNITYSLEVSDVLLNLDTAIPCGLIINELISNSIKHAYTEEGGLIKIKLLDNVDEIEMIVSDKGVGLPSEFDIEDTTTLGLKLVYTLVKQLNGTIKLDKDQGTCITIRFEEKLTHNNK